MGKVTTPIYRLLLYDQTLRVPHILAWHGRATYAKLERYIYDYVNSLKPGGVNYHISKMYGFMPVPHRAVIIHQKSNTAVVEWKAPTFMAINPRIKGRSLR